MCPSARLARTRRYAAQHARSSANLAHQRLGVAFNANLALVRVAKHHHHVKKNFAPDASEQEAYNEAASFLAEGLRWVMVRASGVAAVRWVGM